MAELAAQYLDEVGAKQVAKLFRAVIGIFPDGKVPADAGWMPDSGKWPG